MAKGVTHLYQKFKPTSYKLVIAPDAHSMSFSGEVTIKGSVTSRPSKRLTFHQKELSISSAFIIRHTKNGNEKITPLRIYNHSSYDELRLYCEQLLYAGNYTITIKFSGKITDNMHGIYRSTFKQNNVEKVLLATQLESHHARELFPCIDEPSAKATFDLTTHTIIGEAALSNMPIIKQTELDNKLVTVFDTTPKMSTYLLAIVTGELSYKESHTSKGVTVRTYSTPDNVEFCNFALSTAVKMLDFYNDYFSIDYPLPKCDLVALPDFAAGAMENWGLITFREQGLLLDPSNTSIQGQQYIAMVVGHELAHQWFGNLVTMRWWTDLWLNEGFASWIEYMAVDFLWPDWQMWTQFASDERLPSMKLDALEHTHPVVVPINNPDDIRTIFDAISYGKGANIIQMLHEYLGKDLFRKGLQLYLKKHKYGNTDTVDLWDALESVSKKQVKDFITAWTDEAGHPILSSTIKGEKLVLKQQRFYINPSRNNIQKPTLWHIPLLNKNSILPPSIDKECLELTPIKESTPLINKGGNGFYRILYDRKYLAQLGIQIKDKQTDPIDRLTILSDSFEASKAGYSKTIESLKLLENYTNEDNAAVWDVIANNLLSIRAVMNDDELRENMKPYTLALTTGLLAKLGWDTMPNDTHFDKLLRPTILSLSAISDEPKVIKKALALYKSIKIPTGNNSDANKARDNNINPDIRAIIYRTAARKGDLGDFNKLIILHNSTNSSEEKLNFVTALTSFEQPEIIDKALSCIISKDVRLQDVMYWLIYSFANRHAKDQTWTWMIKHWKWLEKNLGTDMSFCKLPVHAARAYSDISFLETYTSFFNTVTSASLERSIKQGIETIQWQSLWKERDLLEIKKYFSGYK